MLLSPLPNVGWAALTAQFGGYALLVTAPLTILIEALSLRYLSRFDNSLQRILLYSFLANLISGLIGYLGMWLVGPGILQFTGERLGPRFGEKVDFFFSGNAAFGAALLVLVVILWLMSTIIEWQALAAFRPQSRRLALRAAVQANLFTHAVLGLLAVYWYRGIFLG